MSKFLSMQNVIQAHYFAFEWWREHSMQLKFLFLLLFFYYSSREVVSTFE